MTQLNPQLNTNPVSTDVEASGYGPLAGDWSDDDGQALEDYFEAGPQGPMTFEGVDTDVETRRPPTTRMIVRSYDIYSLDGTTPCDPVMAFPADPDRLELWIESDAAGLVIAGDKGDCYESNAVFKEASGWSLYSQSYTGPVWLHNPNPATHVKVMARAVTR